MVRLDLSEPPPEPPYELLHALLMSLPSFSKAHDAQPKPFSLFPRVSGENSVSFELSLLGSFSPEGELKGLRGRRLGEARVEWVEWRVVAEASEQELVSRKPKRRLGLRFTSPTAFRSQGVHKLFPEPEALFGSLFLRWNGLLGLKLPEADFSRVLVSRYSLRTEPYPLSEVTLIGFKGEVYYDLKLLPKPQRATVWALANFGLFAGVGYKTTMGMGRTELI